ncbi:MAG: TatD family hydrolase [Lachnospiraceae bacterium]|nr:TatD family hydrolase [Lachnospiraceae bacterium]
MIIDTHAHYDDKAFDEDRAELLQSMQGAGVERIVNIGSSLGACKRTIQLMEQYDFVYGALGIHPTDSGELTESDIEWIRENCALEKCVAVGEIGLDYYWDEPDRAIQRKWFVRQLALAREVKLPVVIHSRDAAQDTVDIMKAENARDLGGVVHCYSYSKELAKTFLDMGFYFGIGGVVTFGNGRKLKEVVEYLPLDRMVLETDSPYLAPVPFRGKRNDSRKLTHVVEQIAQIKGISLEEVQKTTTRNAYNLYPKLK